jgi:hypothetical protein
MTNKTALEKIVQILENQATMKGRRVAFDDYAWGSISTAGDNESKTFQTAIKSWFYWEHYIVVEIYVTKEEAERGHGRWRDLMTANPPRVLQDVGPDAKDMKFEELKADLR